MKPLFFNESTLGVRLLIIVVTVGVLLLADLHFNRLENARAAIDGAARPVFWLADLPSRVIGWAGERLRSRAGLQEEVEQLRLENLVLHGRSNQMSALRAENVRLRSLLNSTAILRDDVLVAELIGVSPDPVRHQVILNKGSDDGVYIGQPLIDADGLMGQVVEVGASQSRVLLITDTTHSLPVQVNRNGVRAIAEGSGELGALEIHHVSATTDIREGDLLVSSGLGGRFPVGYPVAEVTEIERDPGQPFARVVARPAAALDRTRHVLLVFTGGAGTAAVLPSDG